MPVSPAWPKPARGSLWQRLDSIEARVADDRAHVPLLFQDAAGGTMALLAFAGHDCLLALDADNGQERWRSFAEAPIRFAPTVVDGVAYFGADDGRVRAVDLETGQPLWQARVGPELPWIVGNRRLIASHPIRTSVLVEGRRVLCHAGLFPSQGVYSVALNRRDGSLLWRRRISQSPQGYLLSAATGRAIVPTGRSTPYMVSVENGSLLGDLPSPGGSFCMLADDQFFSGPGNQPTFQRYAAPAKKLAGDKLLPLAGKLIAAGAKHIWSADDLGIRCYAAADAQRGEEAEAVWKREELDATAMIASGPPQAPRLFVATASELLVLDGHTGKVLTRTRLPFADHQDPVLSLAVSGTARVGTLLAVTQAGLVQCFQTRPSSLASNTPSRRAPSPNSAERRIPRASTAAASQISLGTLNEALESLVSDAGLALVSGPDGLDLAMELAEKSRLHVALLGATPASVAAWRTRLMDAGLYGQRIVVYPYTDGPVRFADRLFNLVVHTGGAKEYPKREELERVLAGGGILCQAGQLWRKPVPSSLGTWTHQYASPANRAESGDQLVGSAAAFRLAWFGGVGPSRMPDRHLRGAAPLASGQSMVLHGDEILIGVDPANGTERWQQRLPSQTMRYGMPYDAGYSALSRDGRQLYSVVGNQIWHLDAASGEVLRRINMPTGTSEDRWGYLALHQGALIATSMRRSAPRLELDRVAARESYTNQDYNSQRPLVCSRSVYRLRADGDLEWQYSSDGLIPHGSIAIAEQGDSLVFVEGLSAACQTHATDRAPLAELMQDARLVCLHAATGQARWQQELRWPEARNVLYSQIADNRLILVTSDSRQSPAEYFIRVLRLNDGELLWTRSHKHIRQGLTHGEQVHHPVTLQTSEGTRQLVVEPYLYDLESGERRSPPVHGDAPDDQWALVRPGHSCGTLSAAGSCLFFRANNPTVLRLDAANQDDPFTALSPSRPSCWINMIPATGRLLIPEGSASCVCNYSLQTSMAFAPVAAESAGEALELLDDFPSLDTESVQPLYGWDFTGRPNADTQSRARTVSPNYGQVALQAKRDLQFADGSLEFRHGQWLAQDFEAPELPTLPRTISLAAWVWLAPDNPEWVNFVGGLQDNGSYERGFGLGMHAGRLTFAIAADGNSGLTYLESGAEATLEQWHYVVGTYDGSVMQLFVDGKLRAVSRQQRGALLVDPTSWLAVGAYKDANEEFSLVGKLRSVTIYQGALPASEIRAHWRAGLPRGSREVKRPADATTRPLVGPG